MADAFVQGDSLADMRRAVKPFAHRLRLACWTQEECPESVETMSLEIADHTLFVSWSRMPQQQHGAQQQPEVVRPDAKVLALMKKRQHLAMLQSKVRLR